MTYVGIDPGEHGAWAFIADYGAAVVDLPSNMGWEANFRPGEAIFYIEDPQPVPKQSAKSLKTFWSRVGYMEGYLRAKGHNVYLVRPQDWKRRVFFGTPEARQFPALDKKASLALASRWFPDADLGKGNLPIVRRRC